MIPKTPSPIRAHSKSSGSSVGEHVTRSPFAVTSSNPITAAAMGPSRWLVPWVPVERAPARVCLSMSPRLDNPSPRLASSSLRTNNLIPASTVIVIASRSTSITRSSASIRSIRESVHAISENECPVAAMRTRCPALSAEPTNSHSSKRLLGDSIDMGSQVWLRPQFCHAPLRATVGDPTHLSTHDQTPVP